MRKPCCLTILKKLRTVILRKKAAGKKMLFFLAVCLCGVAVLFFMMKLPRLPQEKVNTFIEIANKGPLAHRGGKPENTLAAITKSSKQGASGVEVDLSFSKDGEPVLLHDSRVDRTSNGSGRVNNLTLKQLKKLDFGMKTGG